MPPRVKKYIDLDISLERNLLNDDIFTIEDIQAVKTSVKNLILTNKGEIIFDDNKGGDLYKSLFKNYKIDGESTINSLTTISIEDQIRSVISRYEPRVTIERIDIKESIPKNSITLDVIFTIETQLDPITVNLFLERIT